MLKFVIVIGIVAVGVSSFLIFKKEHVAQVACTQEAKLCPDGSAVGRTGPKCEFAPCPEGITSKDNGDKGIKEERVQPVADVSVPLDQSGKRVTKKPFGIFVTPKDSPVQPERFRGYHTGTDFEIFSEELKKDVSVRAVCLGTVVVKRSASGYGGVVVERCVLDDKPVTVVYGHLVLESITKDVGDILEKGETIGWLGASGSADTDGERKHLHLGIHKGDVIDIRGYVAEKSMLEQWLDPCVFFCK